MFTQKEISKMIRLRMVALFFIVLGALNWGLLGAFDINIVEIISKNINNLFNSQIQINKIIYIIIGICALYIASDINNWLPFLGPSILPSNVISLKKLENTDNVIKIQTKYPNMKVVYWASSSKDENAPVDEAYNDYNNSGVVMTDKDGNAELPIKSGASYVVPGNKKIPRHVHYRVIGLPWQMMGKIHTVKY